MNFFDAMNTGKQQLFATEWALNFIYTAVYFKKLQRKVTTKIAEYDSLNIFFWFNHEDPIVRIFFHWAFYLRADSILSIQMCWTGKRNQNHNIQKYIYKDIQNHQIVQKMLVLASYAT